MRRMVNIILPPLGLVGAEPKVEDAKNEPWYAYRDKKEIDLAGRQDQNRSE